VSITNLTVIEDALREINVISEVDNASAEQGSDSLRRLNQMMEVWREDGIDFGYYPQTETNESCPIPDWAELAVTTGLAITLAPKFGASISAELAAVGSKTYRAVSRKSLSEKLDNMDMTQLPIGQGHFGHGYDINTDN
jgi:hypothetical protein